MPILGKKFPTPIARPMMPFFAASLIIAYGISNLQDAMSNSDDFKNDPRNPKLKNAKPAEH